MIKIVTIEREYGSGGGEIAQLLAEASWLEALGSVAHRGDRAGLRIVPRRSSRVERNEPIRCTTGSSNRFCAEVMKEASMRTSSTWWTAKAF